jgi:hypothetical protein
MVILAEIKTPSMESYRVIPEYPPKISAGTILTRLLDGLGFRFYWATEGLRKADYEFRPSQDCMSVEELVRHTWGLVNWVVISATDNKYRRPAEAERIREQVLEMVLFLRDEMSNISVGELSETTIDGRSFWHIINGPIADTLTHVGQINSFRRLSGNPVPKANVFTGTPPEE